MDPITAAIVAGLAAGAGKVGTNAVTDAYMGLKQLLTQIFGGESKILKAVGDLEDETDSVGYRAVLQEQVTKAKADQNPKVLNAAQALLDQVKAQPGGEEHIQNAVGDYIAQADRGSTAQVHINKT